MLFSLIKSVLFGSILLSCVCRIEMDSKTTPNLQFVVYHWVAPVKNRAKNTTN